MKNNTRMHQERRLKLKFRRERAKDQLFYNAMLAKWDYMILSMKEVDKKRLQENYDASLPSFVGVSQKKAQHHNFNSIPMRGMYDHIILRQRQKGIMESITEDNSWYHSFIESINKKFENTDSLDQDNNIIKPRNPARLHKHAVSRSCSLSAQN